MRFSHQQGDLDMDTTASRGQLSDTPMIDALEAVRRLTLERDALAEQVKRLEAEAANTPPRHWDMIGHGLWAHEGVGFTAYVCYKENSGSHFGDFYAQVCHGNAGIRDIAPFDSFDRAADHAIAVGLDLTGNAPQAPERRATAETDAETGEGGNGAPRGGNVPSRTCETCKHWIENTRPGYMSTGYCHCHAPIANPDGPESLAHFPLTAHNVRCGEWEART